MFELRFPDSWLTPYVEAGCHPFALFGGLFIIFLDTQGLGFHVSLRSLATPSQVRLGLPNVSPYGPKFPQLQHIAKSEIVEQFAKRQRSGILSP